MELENNEEGKGKGNKKRIAIIAVVVAALIAAGIAAFLLLLPHNRRQPLQLGHIQRGKHEANVLQMLQALG